MQKIIPQLLKKGDEIRVVAPSVGIKIISQESRQIAATRFAQMGLKVSFGKNTTDENFDQLGTSAALLRAQDIMEAFADPNVRAIFTIIGGFNSNQVLPLLDYELIKRNPKIICGFSDITALINGIYAKTNMVTFLGPHYSSFGMKHGFDYTWQNMQKMLFEGKGGEVEPSKEWSDDLWFMDQEKREFVPNTGYWQINQGSAKGRLIGGNLCTQILLLGSSYFAGFNEDSILLVEDTATTDSKEFLRNLQALAYQPNFDKVKGIVIGRFQEGSHITREVLEYIIGSIPQLCEVPILANADFGHTTPLLTLPIGGVGEIAPNGAFYAGF